MAREGCGLVHGYFCNQGVVGVFTITPGSCKAQTIYCGFWSLNTLWLFVGVGLLEIQETGYQKVTKPERNGIGIGMHCRCCDPAKCGSRRILEAVGCGCRLRCTQTVTSALPQPGVSVNGALDHLKRVPCWDRRWPEHRVRVHWEWEEWES